MMGRLLEGRLAARRLRTIGLFAGAAAFGGVVGRLLVRSHSTQGAGLDSSGSYTQTATTDSIGGRHEVAVFLGMAACGSCRLPELPGAVRLLLDSLRKDAARRGDRFSTLGVVLDDPSPTVIRWLNQFGTFDEIAVGGNWLNTAVAKMVWDDHTAKPGVPQLILLRHDVEATSTSIQVGADSVLRRWLGARQLVPSLAVTNQGKE
jgi:hypothetical protein